MTRRPGWARPVTEGGAIWVHYGANIGALGGELSIQSTSDDLRAMAAAELTRAGQPPNHIAPKTLAPSGETRDIHHAAGCYVTLVGSSRCSICRRTAGRTPSILGQSFAPPPPLPISLS